MVLVETFKVDYGGRNQFAEDVDNFFIIIKYCQKLLSGTLKQVEYSS
jgi:hypothetical protein